MKKLLALLSCLIVFTGSAEAVINTIINDSPIRSGLRTFSNNSAYRYKDSYHDQNTRRYNRNYNRQYSNQYNNQYNNQRNDYYRDTTNNNNNYYDQPRYNNGYYNQNQPLVIRRIRGGGDKTNEKNISMKNQSAEYHYPKVTQVEQSILGRTFENQDIDLRLNRLERSVFNKTYPNMSYEQRVNNIIVNYNLGSDFVANPETDILSNMEKNIFKRDFLADSPENRVGRLEEKIFGARQSGDISERVDTLKRASKNYSNNKSSYAQPAMTNDAGLPYYTPIVSSGGWRRNAWNTGNFLMGGTPTGFSPQMPQMSPSYMDYLESRNYNSGGGESDAYTSNRGYGYNSKSYGSSSGVTILD